MAHALLPILRATGVFWTFFLYNLVCLVLDLLFLDDKLYEII